MPQHRSAAKRVRQNARRRARNRHKRSRVRTMMKKLRAMDDKEKAAAYLNEVKSMLDRLAAKNVIHPNKAANYKSKLQKRVNAL